MDTVSLYALALAVDIGPDCWHRTRPQPVLVTVHVQTALETAGRTDDVGDTIDYGQLSKAILALAHRAFASLHDLAIAVAETALSEPFAGIAGVHVVAEAPKLFLQAKALVAELFRARPPLPGPARDSLQIKDLSVDMIIGVNAPERVHKQRVITSISFANPDLTRPFPHHDAVARLTEHIEATAFLTLEAFATSVARHACRLDSVDVVTVTAHKPSAVAFAHSSAVEITRNRAFFLPANGPRLPHDSV